LTGVYFQQQRYDLAGPNSEDALRLARKAGDNRDITNCLNSASDVALATGHDKIAEKYNQEALGIEKAGLDQFGVVSSTIIAGRIAASKKQYREAEKAFQKVIRDPGVETPQRWEAQAGLAQVHAAMGHMALAEREFSKSVSIINKAWNDLQREEFRLSYLSSAIRFYDAYVNFLIEQKRPLDALKVADRSRAQTLERGLSPKVNGESEMPVTVRPEEIASRWNATLVFYWLGEQRSHLWVITPTKVSLLPLPGRSEIDARVKSYLDAFPEPRDPLEKGNADGKKLYEMLIEPAEKLIPKNSRVLVLPDGGLTSLNFETLIVPGDEPHYWIEDVTLSTGNSLALLAKASPAAPPADASLFLMGDALQASPDFPALPQAGKEVGLVEKYFPTGRRSVFTGAQATPSRYLSGKPEDFSYLHFATHGTASTLRPLESAVILSPEGDAYKLYARDIVQHPVHAYLVTISACNGAGMKTYAGEGLVGLAWAFLRAGAHNVIGGLWEVSNASTPQLMDELYKGLNDGKDPASALRNAKLSLVHSTGNYRRAYYWAPFQLYAGS
jgi:CHAT domain-containing protein